MKNLGDYQRFIAGLAEKYGPDTLAWPTSIGGQGYYFVVYHPTQEAHERYFAEEAYEYYNLDRLEAVNQED